MLGRLERAVERIVDGGIANLFRLRVQPAEIGRQLERAMLDGRVASVGTTLAPNAFDVRLHPEDAAAFAGWSEALNREMETWLAEVAFARGLSTVGPIHTTLVEDPGIHRRSVRVEGRFDAAAIAPRGERRTDKGPRSRLRLVSLGPSGPRIDLSSGTKTVGRSADNDFVLESMEVSRHHARFEPAGVGWKIRDLGSTNGTWVNGERIDEAEIFAGDEVSLGGVRFTVAPG